MVACNVYWVRQAEHTDIFSQGYVGITNNFTKRMTEHKRGTENAHFKNAVNKYGWNNLVKEIIVIAEKNYCLDLETKLRPTDEIGWNLTKGGNMPPSFLGKKRSESNILKLKNRVFSNDTKQKIATALTGNKNNLGQKRTDATKKLISDKHKGNKHCLGKYNTRKYKYIGTNQNTGEAITIIGMQQAKELGFHLGHIGECANGKSKSHKGYSWKKELINVVSN
jgi:group I intron endonuclease